MKALVLTAYRKLEIQDLPRPEPGPDELRVRVHACGICGSDVHGFDGSTGRRIPPIIMGHEAAGVVDAVGRRGEGVPGRRPRHLRLDDLLRRVRLLPRRAGRTSATAAGCWASRRATTGSTARSPSTSPCRSASSAASRTRCRSSTRRWSSRCRSPCTRWRRARVAAGDTRGGGRLRHDRPADAAGRRRRPAASSVIAVDLDEGRLRMARAARGRRHAQLGRRRRRGAGRWSSTGGRGADVAFEAVGAAAPIATAVRSLRKGGTLVLVGNVTPQVEVDAAGDRHARALAPRLLRLERRVPRRPRAPGERRGAPRRR